MSAFEGKAVMPGADVGFCGRYWGKADMAYCNAYVR
jgi:hypothetical protein